VQLAKALSGEEAGNKTAEGQTGLGRGLRPQYFLQMAEEYDGDRLEQLNECLGKGDYTLVSEATQGFAGDLVIDFHIGQDLNEPYRALIML
jgi:hypothetical protein